MSGEDIGNVDAVQSEAEAIQRAEAFLAVLPERRRQHWEEWSKRTGRAIPPDPQAIYIFREIIEVPLGWILKYDIESLVGATFDPGFADLTVNRKTGETRFNHFRDE